MKGLSWNLHITKRGWARVGSFDDVEYGGTCMHQKKEIDESNALERKTKR